MEDIYIEAKQLAELSKLLRASFPAILKLSPDERHGAVVAVRPDAPESGIDSITLGHFPVMGKEERYTQLAREKIMRLSIEPDDLGSYETRNPTEDRWGGAIRSLPVRILLSCSGLPELLDEAYMLAIAVKLEWCSPIRAKRIMHKSQNEYYERAWVAVSNAVPQ